MADVTTGKTGADVIYKLIKHIALVIVHYGPKLTTVITAAQAAGVITAAEASIITDFINGVTALVSALQKLADYSGFAPHVS